MERLSGKVDGDIVDSTKFNILPLEIQTVIVQSGLTLSADLNQFAIALANFASIAGFYTGGGTADVQTLTTLSPFPISVAYFNGKLVHWRPTNANAGATTINIDGRGAKDLKKDSDGLALSASDLITARDAKARFDFGNDYFRLLGV